MGTGQTADGSVRTPLSRDRILVTAVAMADTGGLDSLTMRSIGHELGVEAMSLYNHVRDKGEILAGIADLVLSEFDIRPPARDWRTATRESAISAHEALLRHPWSCELILAPRPPRILPARMRWIESILARFRAAGFSPAAASRGYHAIDSHVLGFTLWELGHRLPDDAPPDFLERVMRETDFSAFPYLLEHAAVHRAMSEEPELGEFEFGLDLILEGLDRHRTSQ